MKIGIDVRCLAEGRRTGVEEYTLNLLENLFRIDSKNEYVLFFNSFSKPKVSFTWINKYPNVRLKKFRIPNKILNFLFWYLNWPKIDKLVGGVDIFFLPNIIFGSFSQKTKLILTIHDLSFERHLENFSWKRKLWHIFINPKKICRRANQLIAVSDSTKADLVNLYGISEEKIERIYSGIGERFKALDRNNPHLIQIKEKYKLPYKFILYLGTIEPRKNILGTINAFNYLQKKAHEKNWEEIKKIKLVLAGHTGWLNEEIFEALDKSHFKKDIFYLGSIPDEDKVYLYNLASLFIYPSFFEGFGFPTLEAMACEIPVISSNNSSLAEIIGSAGILIDPSQSNEIYLAMKEILFHKELLEDLKIEGKKQAANFNWPKTARETLKVFKKLGKYPSDMV